MADRTIVELQKKLTALIKSDVAKRIGGHNGTENSFGEVTIGRSALRSLRKKNSPKIDVDDERKIADVLRFRIDWPQWQTGTAEQFIAEYERHHRNSAPVRDTSALLVKGPPEPPELGRIKGLAAIELLAEQLGRGTACVGFELSCGVTQMFGIPLAIRVGEITLDCAGGRLDSDSRKGRGQPFQLNNGSVSLTWNGSTNFQPSWRIEAIGSSIGNVDVSPDFATVSGLAPGDMMLIVFGVWLPSIEEAETLDMALVAATNDAASVPFDVGKDVNPATLDIVKRRILMRLAANALERNGDFVVLARHRVKLVRALQE